MEKRKRNRKIADCTGQKFGMLTAVSLVERRESRNHLWLWSCECGGTSVSGVRDVKKGHTKSCGCLQRASVVARNLRHGASFSERQTYRSWKDMRSRCNNPNDSDYSDYGGRGISICGRWGNFVTFLADMGSRPVGATLDRINVNGNYEPGNCRWADAMTQANNKRTNHVLESGETLSQASRRAGLSRSKVWHRLKAGYSLEDALSNKDFRKCQRQESSFPQS